MSAPTRKKEEINLESLSKEERDLIHRLNRAQGQIEAIKRLITEEGAQDCLKTIQLVKAANNALKKFAEAFVREHLDRCVRNDMPLGQIERNLKDVVSSAFNL